MDFSGHNASPMEEVDQVPGVEDVEVEELTMDQQYRRNVIETYDVMDIVTNTEKTYKPAIDHWNAWISSTEYQAQPPETNNYIGLVHLFILVTGDKLFIFLNTQVIGRLPQKKGRKQRDFDRNDLNNYLGPVAENGQMTIGIQTINKYCSALVGLWKKQKEVLRITNCAHPRSISQFLTVDVAVKKLIDNARNYETTKKRLEYRDRGIGTIFESYTTNDELLLTMDYFWHDPLLSIARSRYYDSRVSTNFRSCISCLLVGNALQYDA